ncbi:MAG: DinB family protein [Fimbriimonadaceae bacterium]
MPDFIALARDFDYDLWANRLWLACLTAKGLPQPDTQILAHILSAQHIWLRRVQGDSLTAMPTIEPSESELVRLNTEWNGILLGACEDRQITYRRTTGEEFTVWLSDIAHHATNHGTYHRGELRGLCRARDDGDFPETDFAGFMLMKPAG